nr:MAG TPA: hypothetical protein [Caudoviricetes sp.]
MANRWALSQGYTLEKGYKRRLNAFLYWKGDNLGRISGHGASNNFVARGNIEHLLHGCKT